ncbi:MAG TPA: hypothetical protein VMS31_11330 [Pyrinomonadaceae bacterium]|nr:hypothetical protein [Pyrinomonadaceae bacterium]
MQETTESGQNSESSADNPAANVMNELCDALRYLGDASYAILPKDIAHNLGDLKKSFLSTIRSFIEKDIEWVDARVSGGDRLREEWEAKCNRAKSEGAPEPVN